MASVLVVDDDAASREYLRALIAHRGHHVQEAADGDTALRIANQNRPDAIVTDVLMPGLDGCELARVLRSQPATASVPIVFNTAHYDKREIQPLARACGVRHIIRKPAKPAAVLAIVDAVLSTAGGRPAEPAGTGPDFTEQHRTAFKAKLLQTTLALQSSRSREDRLRHEVTHLRDLLGDARQQTPPEAVAGIWRLAPHSGTVLLSTTLVDRLGLPARLTHREIWQRVHPADRRALAHAIRTARRSGQPRTARLRIGDADGTVHDFAVICRSAGPQRLWGTAQELVTCGHDQPERLSPALYRAHRLISDSWHAAMVPRTPPPLSTADLATAYLPAPGRVDTGADWYDAMPLPDGRILLSIGSVAGHRLPGPTVAGPMRAVLRAYALGHPEPADLLARVNRYLTATTGDDTYLTAVAALYHPGTGRLDLANAGHPAPLVIVHDPGTGVPTVHSLPTTDPPLGIRDDVEYHTRSLLLDDCTCLFAYTDGLTDDYADPTAHLVDAVRTALTGAPDRRAPTAGHLLNRLRTALRPVTPSHDDIGLLVLAPRA